MACFLCYAPVFSVAFGGERFVYYVTMRFYILFLQEKGSVSRQIDERTEVGLTGRDSDRTELKKRGLCLVPLSSIHFLG